MQAGRRTGAIRQGSGEYLNLMGSEQLAHLEDAGDFGAVSVADDQRVGIQPYHVSGFGASRGSHFPQHRNAKSLTEAAMCLGLRNTVGFSRMQEDETVIGCQGWVMCVDRIQGEICGIRQM